MSDRLAPRPTGAQTRAAIAQIIERAISERGTVRGDYDAHPTARVPQYVYRLCEHLAAWCNSHGASGVTTDAVLKRDALAAGHVDYVRKFALYVSELLPG